MMKKNNRRVVLAVVLILVVCAATIGGTIAWLTDKTDDVVNTFTPSNIDITLTETEPEGNTAKMVPGNTIEKNPKVTVLANSEACWLFVKIEKKNNFNHFMTYGIADGWTAVPDTTDVYFRMVGASAADQDFAVLADDQVTVLDTVKKEDMDALQNGAAKPTLTFTAYAIQQAGFEAEISEGATEPNAEQLQAAAATAWAKINEEG